MKIIGIIAEYNPFHKGHLYQIKEIKKRYPDSIIIAIISTYFTQRGDISILNKWDKTRICLNNNIDIVIELPTLYATQSADIFAYGALKILNNFKIDTLVFGTESNNIDNLINLANIQLNDKEYNKKVKLYLDKGINYPTAMSKALNDIANISITKPNDLLGLSYVKQIIKHNYNITPISIKRTNDYHDTEIKSNIINASLIRNLYKDNKSIKDFIPKNTYKYFYKNLDINKAYPFLIYNINNNKDILNNYLDVDEGIEGRILNNLSKSSNWNDLVNLIKTKRYTYNKVNRMLIHILLNIKKSDNIDDIYLRILGFNIKGQQYLNKIKKSVNKDIYFNYKPEKNKILDIEIKTAYIYSLIVNDKTIINKEFSNNPIILR